MQIFVFGSNRAGRHGKGAALHAIQRHGAKYWQGEGLQGQSYAIPTKDENIRTLPLPCIAIEVEKFKKFAAEHPELTFNVTAIGCGLAGYIPEQIAPMFSGSTSNVLLPDEFKIALFYSLVAEKEALQKEVAKLKTTQLRKVHVSDEDTENDYGYFIEIENELYCDIIKSKQGKWSVFFYDRKAGKDALGDQVDIDELRAKIVELEQAAPSGQSTFMGWACWAEGVDKTLGNCQFSKYEPKAYPMRERLYLIRTTHIESPEVAELRAVVRAVDSLVKCKGRFHTEQNFKALEVAYKAYTDAQKAGE